MNYALNINDLHKNFGMTNIIRGINLDVIEGEIHAIIGPNGAGKSTFFNLLSGAFSPTSGEIKLFDKIINNKSPEEIQKIGLSRSFQVSNIFTNMSVFENLRCASFKNESAGYIFWKSANSITQANRRAVEILELIELEEFRNHIAGELPYASQRALEIGMAIACDAPVIILDEPTAGMSNTETEKSINLIKKISTNKTLMIVEHDMNVVFGLADRISVLVYGQLIATGTPREIKSNQEVQMAYLGEDFQ